MSEYEEYLHKDIANAIKILSGKYKEQREKFGVFAIVLDKYVKTNKITSEQFKQMVLDISNGKIKELEQTIETMKKTSSEALARSNECSNEKFKLEEKNTILEKYKK